MPSDFSGPLWETALDRLDRSGSPTPARVRSYPLWGFHGQGAEGEYYSSLSADSALETIRALYYAVNALETAGTLSAPAGGHDHSAANTHMPWCQVGSWRLTTLLSANIGDPVPLARIVNETSETVIALTPFSLPLGASRVIPSAQVQIPTSGVGLKLRLQFYAPANLNAASADVDAGYLSATGRYTSDGTNTGGAKWLEGGSVDLSGIALTDSKRLVYLKVSAQVTSGTADVVQIHLGLDPSARADLTLVDPVDTAATPDEALTADELSTLFINNPLYLRQSVYGVTYPLPRHSRPHDHGEGRGETLTDRHLLSLIYGPHVAEDGGAVAGGTIGIPILEPASGVDYTATEKVLTEQGIFVPGGVESVKFRVAGYFPGTGTRTATLIAEVRPLSDVGYGPGDNLGVTGTLSFSTTSDYAEATATLDLSSLGDVHRDRVFDLTIWQASNPPAASVYRLASLLAYAGTAPTSLPELATHQPREELPVSKILEGQELSTLLADKAARVLNQLSYEALGGVPGLETDLRTVDTTDPWRRLLTGPHQHRGTYEDSQGARVDDGAVIRRPLWAQAYTAHVAGDGSGAEDSTGTANPVRGQLLDTGGDPDFVGFGGRCSIPAGLGAVDVYALIQPATSNRFTRLRVAVNTPPVGATANIHTAMRSGPFVALANTIGSDLVGQCLPQDGVLWQPNAARLSQGLGVWTQDALVQTQDLPSTASATYPARWTQPIRIEITPDPGDSGAYDINFDLYFGLQDSLEESFEVSGSYDLSARLLALLVIPAAGY
jgi:hypothetical protein